MSLRFLRLAAALAAPLLLLGCGTAIQICPVPVILADAATMTVFRPGTQPDLANEAFTVSLIDAQSSCTYAKREGTTTSSLDLTFRATRPPSGDGATYSVTYFVAVQENAKLYDKKNYTLRFSFAPGATTATIKQSPDSTDIKIANSKLPWNYQLMSGLQVTPEQIEYNKKMGRYVP